MVRGTRSSCDRFDAVHARKVPNSSGPIQFGSCEIGNTTGSPVSVNEGDSVGSGGGSAMNRV